MIYIIRTGPLIKLNRGALMRDNAVINIERLWKRYGAVTALENVSFEVYEGEIFGLVGPNGAGKTTLIECIEGMRRPDGGSLQVLGLNPIREGYSLRQLIGMQLQHSELPDDLKIGEAMDLFASFYSGQKIKWEALLASFELTGKRNSRFSTLSGGQKQRLFIALALINNPRVVFLDELTTGLDPHARRCMWDLVREIRDQGKTVFLTTHFMEEAERLCDRVGIMESGSLVALDTPEKLIKSLGIDGRLIFSTARKCRPEMFNKLPGVNQVEISGERVTVHGNGSEYIYQVVSLLHKRGIGFRELRTEQANLEDVFLKLTGKRMEANSSDAYAQADMGLS